MSRTIKSVNTNEDTVGIELTDGSVVMVKIYLGSVELKIYNPEDTKPHTLTPVAE
jgi:hypothetical protein